jgi:hypothetical protein
MNGQDGINMQAKIEINAEYINQYLSKAILDSVIGKNLQAAMEQVKGSYTSYSLKTVVEREIDSQVRAAVSRLIAAEFDELITKIVRECATEEVIKKMASKAWEKLTRDYY